MGRRAAVQKILCVLDVRPGFARTTKQQVNHERQAGIARRLQGNPGLRLTKWLAQRLQHLGRGHVLSELHPVATGLLHRVRQFRIETRGVAKGRPADRQPAAAQFAADGQGMPAGVVKNAVHEKEMAHL